MPLKLKSSSHMIPPTNNCTVSYYKASHVREQYYKVVKLLCISTERFLNVKSGGRKPAAIIFRLKKLPRRGTRQFRNLMELPPRDTTQFLHAKSAHRRPTTTKLRLNRWLPMDSGQFIYAIESLFQSYEKISWAI